MTKPSLVRRVMAGPEAWTLPVRGLLRLGSLGYGAAVAWRNRRYDHGQLVISVDVPVISVGNITTGGTGKTPLVIEIARRLQERGRTVAVLSRGYKARRGQPADELAYISRRLPGVICVQDPDRTAAARRAIGRHGADVIVLDDAFQHRRLARDLDVVAIDATCPFGFGHLLPRGLLREPPQSLRRADLIVITRADQVDGPTLDGLQDRLAAIAPRVRRIVCRHKPAGLVRLDGHPHGPIELTGWRVVCVSGIGNPDAFERTVRQMGADVRHHLVFADHHRYRAGDRARIAALANRCQADLVLTTEKDGVKLAACFIDAPSPVADSQQCGTGFRPVPPISAPCPVVALRVDIDFMDDGARILASVLEDVLRTYPNNRRIAAPRGLKPAARGNPDRL